MIRLATQEAFDDWVSRMDGEIGALKDSLPESLSSVMDSTVESLVEVEKYLLEHYVSTDALLEDTVNYDRIGRYVGEVLRLHTGDSWHIELEEEEFAFFGSPVLRAPNSAMDSPFRLISTCIHRQTGDYIKTVATSKIRNASKRSD